MEDHLVNLIILGTSVGLILLGYVAGKATEARHYRSIRRRERELLTLPAVTARFDTGGRRVADSTLAIGSVVVSVDYYKRFLGGLRKIFGGELRSYSSVIDRGRREALLRMKESCPEADAILNCRLETSTISSGREGALGCVEILAYGTAITFER